MRDLILCHVHAVRTRQTLRTRWRSTPIDLMLRKNELMFVGSGDGDGAVTRPVSDRVRVWPATVARCGYGMTCTRAPSNFRYFQLKSAYASLVLRQPPCKPPGQSISLNCSRHLLALPINFNRTHLRTESSEASRAMTVRQTNLSFPPRPCFQANGMQCNALQCTCHVAFT
jgi:hypothetical protein